MCECDDAECATAIELPLGEYERAVTPVDRFAVAAGHEDPAVEVVVERRDTYLVVSKPDLKRRRGWSWKRSLPPAGATERKAGYTPPW